MSPPLGRTHSPGDTQPGAEAGGCMDSHCIAPHVALCTHIAVLLVVHILGYGEGLRGPGMGQGAWELVSAQWGAVQPTRTVWLTLQPAMAQ